MALAMLFVGVASAQDAKTAIANATKALGYANLNSIQYSGPVAHEGAGTGQWMSPTKGWHANTVTNFTRYIDYSAGTSQRTGLQSRPGDPATGLLPGGGGLDPSAAPPAQNTSTIAANGNWTQRLDVTLSPPYFLKLAAAAPNVTAKNQSMNGKRYTVVSFPVEQKAPSGVAYTLTGYINNQTNTLDKVDTAYEDAAPFLLGDVLVEQTYSDYKMFNGVQFPTKINQSRGGVPWADVTIADVKPNAPAPAAPEAAPAGGGRGGGAPGAGPGGGRGGAGGPGGGGGAGGGAQAAAGRGAAPEGGAAGGGRGGGGGGAAAAPTGPRKIADGVYVIGGGYQMVAVEFKDHVVLVEAPQNGIADMVAQAKMAIPNKPITHIVTTHMHFDHVGGLRTALAEAAPSVTLVTNEMNKEVVEKWFSNPRTLQATTPPAAAAAAAPAAPAAQGGGARGGGGGAPAPWPDALQQSGKKIKFQYVKDKLVLKDDTNSIEIYPIKGALHSEDMVVVYIPKAKAVFESDAYNPGAPGAVTTGTGQLAFQKLLASELDRLKVDYDKFVSGHGVQGRDATKNDLMVAIGKVPPPAAPAAVPAAPGRGQ
jgi:glyoxylase-like metal-dependent hydrolase (beta-lactamase superfamily II)